MNPTQRRDDERLGTPSVSPAKKADGFAAVMKRLKSRNEQERAQLRAQANAAILGHEAYALGQDNLQRGNYISAKRWLRVAAEHSVPGAEQALEEIEAGLADGLAQPIAVDAMVDAAPCPIGAPQDGTHKFEKWTRLLQNWTEVNLAMNAAQAEAQEIIAQARRTADELVDKAREEADRAWADTRDRVAAERRVSAELLYEAERLQQDARLLVQEALRATQLVIGEPSFAQTLKNETRQHARAITVVNCLPDGLLSEQRQYPALPVRADGTVRTVVTSVDRDLGTPSRFGLPTCTDANQASTWWAWLRPLVEGYSQVRDHLLERSGVDACTAGWLRQHPLVATRPDLLSHLSPAVFHSGLRRLASEGSSFGGIDVVLTYGVMRLGPEPRAVNGAASSRGSQCIARWVTTGDDVVLETSNAEHQRYEACLKIFWVTESPELVVDETGAADIVSVEGAAHGARR